MGMGDATHNRSPSQSKANKKAPKGLFSILELKMPESKRTRNQQPIGAQSEAPLSATARRPVRGAATKS